MRKIIGFILGFIQGTVIIFGFITLMGWAGYMESTYDASGTIINKTDNILIIEDTRGNLWEYETDEYLQKGDKVKFVLFDNHTHTIYDDEIVKIKKSKT